MTSSNYSRLSFHSIFQDIEHIKEFLHNIPMWRFFLSPIKSNCKKVINVVNFLESQLKEKNDLITQCNRSLNEYHSLTSKVLVAREQASQAAQTLEIAPNYKQMLTSQMLSSLGAIYYDINQLLVLNESESDIGKLNSSLELIRDSIRDLNNSSQDDIKMAIKLFNDTATYYTDMQKTISKIIASILRS